MNRWKREILYQRIGLGHIGPFVMVINTVELGFLFLAANYNHFRAIPFWLYVTAPFLVLGFLGVIVVRQVGYKFSFLAEADLVAEIYAEAIVKRLQREGLVRVAPLVEVKP